MIAGHANNKCEQVRQSTVQYRPISHRRRRISESCLLQPAAWMTTTKRREENRIYLYAAVNLKRGSVTCAGRIEATDRHEASRGLSATTGLLVFLAGPALARDKFYCHQSLVAIFFRPVHVCNSS